MVVLLVFIKQSYQLLYGFDNKGYAKMLITVLGSCVMVGPLISMVWSWIDAIQILQGKAVDANGKPLE